MRQQGRAPEAQTPATKQDRDPIERFKEAQREFIGVAGRFDLDPAAKVRTGELREEMKGAALEIAKDPARLREAEHAGIASQVKKPGAADRAVKGARASEGRGLRFRAMIVEASTPLWIRFCAIS